MVLALLIGGCTTEAPESPPSSRPPWNPPSLVNQEEPAQDVLHFVRDVVDARTVELADGKVVHIAQLAAPVNCWSEEALAFARSTLLASAVRITTFLSGDVNLALEDGTDYALLAVRQGFLRAEGADAGLLAGAESEAAAADRGMWGASCDGPDPVPPAATPLRPVPTVTSAPPRPVPVATTVPPRPVSTTTDPRPAPRICTVGYRLTTQWPGGFQASVTVRNSGASPINGWNLQWSFANGQTVTDMWNATPRQSGSTVNAANADYNKQISAGGSVSIGFNGSTRGVNSAPAAFTLNGKPCSLE